MVYRNCSNCSKNSLNFLWSFLEIIDFCFISYLTGPTRQSGVGLAEPARLVDRPHPSPYSPHASIPTEPSAHATTAPRARSPANLGWSRPSRSPPTVPKAPPGSPLHSGPGDLVLASSPGRPRLFSATTTGPPWPPSMLSDATSAPRPRVSSAGRLAVLRRCGPVRWLPHHRAAMPRTPRHHFVVATATVCDLRQIGRASCRERVCQYV